MSWCLSFLRDFGPNSEVSQILGMMGDMAGWDEHQARLSIEGSSAIAKNKSESQRKSLLGSSSLLPSVAMFILLIFIVCWFLSVAHL